MDQTNIDDNARQWEREVVLREENRAKAIKTRKKYEEAQKARHQATIDYPEYIDPITRFKRVMKQI